MLPAGLQQYQQVKTRTGIDGASPHRLIQMLFEGALERIASAKGHIQRGEMARKGEMIGKAIGIIGGLRGVLNFEVGGDIASNLDALYEYMERRLLKANIDSDLTILDEVSGLIHNIKEGWDGIGS
jgi:flagellar protein FliS